MENHSIYSDFGTESLSARGAHLTEQLLAWLFAFDKRCYQLENKPKQHFCNEHTNLHAFSRKYQHYASPKGIICRFTNSNEDLDITKNLLKQTFEQVTDKEHLEFLTAEIITKILAYRTLEIGDSIEIPTRDTLTKYTVDHVFNLWNGMVAYGLVSDKEPILLFRGTDVSLLTEGGRASLIADLDPDGPGKLLYEYAQPLIRHWLEKVCKAGKRARIFGHSLGGIFAVYTLIHEFPLISKDLPSFAINAPGVILPLKKKWDAIEKKQRPCWVNLVARGDIVSKFGLLTGDTILECSNGLNLSPISAHEILYFLEPACFLQKVDLEKENTSPSRAFFTNLHQKASGAMYQMGLKFLFPTK